MRECDHQDGSYMIGECSTPAWRKIKRICWICSKDKDKDEYDRCCIEVPEPCAIALCVECPYQLEIEMIVGSDPDLRWSEGDYFIVLKKRGCPFPRTKCKNCGHEHTINYGFPSFFTRVPRRHVKTMGEWKPYNGEL